MKMNYYFSNKIIIKQQYTMNYENQYLNYIFIIFLC